jgi:hypothetical protein
VLSDHKAVEAVRAYLLGALEERAAAALEERYFTDRAFFLFIREVETSLIEDYLRGRLSPATKARFESRYLTVPELRKRLDEVRTRQVDTAPPQAHMRRYSVMAAAAMIVLCVSGALLYREKMRFDRLPSRSAERPIMAVALLRPGVLKGETAQYNRLTLPPARGDIKLILKVAWQGSPIACFGRILLRTSDGKWQPIWSSAGPIWSEASRGGQQVTFLVDAALFREGDYRVELSGPDGQIRDTYSLRVSPA